MPYLHENIENIDTSRWDKEKTNAGVYVQSLADKLLNIQKNSRERKTDIEREEATCQVM